MCWHLTKTIGSNVILMPSLPPVCNSLFQSLTARCTVRKPANMLRNADRCSLPGLSRFASFQFPGVMTPVSLKVTSFPPLLLSTRKRYHTFLVTLTHQRLTRRHCKQTSSESCAQRKLNASPVTVRSLKPETLGRSQTVKNIDSVTT